MSSTFYMPTINLVGKNALEDSLEKIGSLGLKKMLIVTDKPIVKLGFAKRVIDGLADFNVDAVIYDGVQPNPTMKNANDGLSVYKMESCDGVISLGGGSPHDCAKSIALLATNGGDIRNYEGIDKSKFPQAPLVSINTTAGTASEITRFCIVTDEIRHIKMAIVDKHTTPLISVNDPSLMLMPHALTAATGMDALTHAVEALVSKGATPITDACAEKAIAMIHQHLRTAVHDGENMQAREGMAYAQLAAGMAFNSGGLGLVHGMAHQLGGALDLPHGVCNAVLLPHVQAFNANDASEKLALVAKLMGVDTSNMSTDEAADSALLAIKELSSDVGIPSGLSELGVEKSIIPLLAENALKDACSFTNPTSATKDDVIGIFLAAM